MSDKMFELMEKMYSDFSKRFDSMDERLDKLENGQKKLESGQRKIESTLEHDIKTSLQALHERSGANTSKLDEHSERLNTIENKLDYLALSVNSQDKRLTTVEGKRKAK